MLESAGLISRTRRATARLSHLEADPLRQATEWLVGYREYWEESHDRLDALLAALQVDQRRKEPVMAKTQIDAPAGVPFIDMSREFDAPRDLVFKAYTDPELLVQWLGPRKYKMTVESWDVRDGGKWRYINTRRRRERMGLPWRVPRRSDA